MNSSNAKNKAFKGLMLNFYYDFMNVIFIGTIITLTLICANFLFIFIMSRPHNVSSSNSNAGALVMGFITMAITVFVYGITTTTRSEMNSKFSFPINREIYALANFTSMVLGTLGMLVTITVIGAIEIIIFKLYSSGNPYLLVINGINLENYFLGFISSWGYLLLLVSLTYCVFMYIRQYRIIALLVLGVMVVLFVYTGLIDYFIRFIFDEHSVSLLCLKAVALSLGSHVLGYIPLKKMEVV